ncbi:MAG TPA: hypothetical protein VEY08_03410 [Chloroflexia bacterium]|nr:hypothetical protein [Chloroflexia bacterium]
MAQIYHAKPTSTKLLEGAIAGLLGGLAFALVMLIADFLTPQRPWWSTFWLIGTILTGTPVAEINRFNIVNIGLGLLLHLLVFALLGVGLVQYVPLFRRFKIDRILGGAIYGVVVFLSVYWYLVSFFFPGVSANLNLLALFIASVVGGAVMGWWLKRAAAPAKAAPTAA